MTIPDSVCPCGYRMTDCTNLHGGASDPEPGDISVCLNCGQILAFDSDLRLRKAIAAEVHELMSDEDAWRTLERAQQLIRERGPLPSRSL
jgi:hypothetical protein